MTVVEEDAEEHTVQTLVQALSQLDEHLKLKEHPSEQYITGCYYEGDSFYEQLYLNAIKEVIKVLVMNVKHINYNNVKLFKNSCQYHICIKQRMSRTYSIIIELDNGILLCNNI